MLNVNHIEDVIELLAGLSSDHTINVDSSDISLIRSIARQTFKGTALTDRQLELMRSKVILYQKELEDHGIDVDDNILQLRLPLRQIDRTKSISLVDNKIKIRFIFNKKYIGKIQELRDSIGRSEYNTKEKAHYYDFNEKNCYSIIKAYESCSFEIEQSLFEYYKKLEDMMENKENYVPGIYGLKLKNIAKSAVDFMISDIGEPTIDNLALFRDRAEVYGLFHFDDKDLEKSLQNLSDLSKKLILRSNINVLVPPSKYNLKDVFASVLELNRMPLVVLINEKTALDDIKMFHPCTSGGLVFPENVSVMFRLDNNTDYNKAFNLFIKENNINRPLDNKTKIVYTKKNELPKTLLEKDWKPKTAIVIGSERLDGKVTDYIKTCDLVIHFDSEASPFYYRGIDRL